MNYSMISQFLSQILWLEAAFMLPSLGISIYDGTTHVTEAFFVTILMIVAVALMLRLSSPEKRHGFHAKDGLVCVGIGWIIMSLFGCMPFWISGEIPRWIDAMFEIVSGFTTTGASILNRVEDMSRGNLYWRSFSHWLGGMGVLVFLLAVSPEKTDNAGFTMHLLRAESPGPSVGKLVPKMRETTTILYAIYIVLTLLDVVFLMFGGMPLFDSLCTAFGTAGTGGFGLKSTSLAEYSPYIQNVTTVFMLLFGVSFTCYYMLLIRKFTSVTFDEELRAYIGIFFVSTAVIALNIWKIYPTFGETLRHSAFQVSSIMTTTGFATADFDQWPGLSKTVLVCLMFIGACAGSTGGGFKVGRVLLMVKNLRRSVQKMLRPNRIQTVRINKRPVGEGVIYNLNAFLAAYVVLIFISFLLVSVDNYSVTTSFTAVVACFNNIGPGLEMVGPTGNYAQFSAFSKAVLIFDMLAGRLEIFPILVLFSRSTWGKEQSHPFHRHKIQKFNED